MDIKSYGMTSIIRDRGIKFTLIEHCGNMGSSLSDVKHNVESMLEACVFDELRQRGEESGSPDYLYSLKVPNVVFEEILQR
jgi:hypothetical protein